MWRTHDQEAAWRRSQFLQHWRRASENTRRKYLTGSFLRLFKVSVPRVFESHNRTKGDFAHTASKRDLFPYTPASLLVAKIVATNIMFDRASRNCCSDQGRMRLIHFTIMKLLVPSTDFLFIFLLVTKFSVKNCYSIQMKTFVRKETGHRKWVTGKDTAK